MKYHGTQPVLSDPWYCSSCGAYSAPAGVCPTCNSSPSQDLVFPEKKAPEDRLQELAFQFWLAASL